jgi:hypothetical protein
MNTGQQLWVENRTTPTGATGWGLMGPVGNGIYTEYDKGARQWVGYNVKTGKKIWGPSEAYTNPWASLPTNDFFALIAYDTFYSFTVDGIHAHDIETGERLWDFYGAPAGADFPGYSNLPFENNMLYTIADEKVIASTGDSHGVPQYRGARLYVVDAFNGTEVWSVGGYYQGTMPVADGHLVAFNAYDNQIYCFGKGQTATTVSALPKVSVHGDSILIEGTVTDQSAGETCLGVPAAGTPAIADDSMSDWMEYFYMQQMEPDNATGVEVVLETLDPNGNFYEIGRTTSDAGGMYSYAFTPEVPGLYTIFATFEGSESYYSSRAETAINVEEAPQASPTPTPPPPGMTDTYVIGFGSAALIAIIVVGAILILLRRR